MCSNHPRKILPVTFILVVLLLALTASGLGQSLYPKKDLIFTQVFAGPLGGNNYTAVISVTNRAVLPYSGNLLLKTGAAGADWNPLVNSVRVTGGMLGVTIQPDATKVFVITDTAFIVGYAMFLSSDWSLDNYIEGNLSYFTFIDTYLGDAVGVPESQEFLITSLPFDNFKNVGLSLAHPDINNTGLPVTIDVILFDANGIPVGTADFPLAPGGHFSAYLKELQWDGGPVPTSFHQGKVEISCDQAVSGIAMLITPSGLTGSQISTLPLGGTPLTYEVTFTSDTGETAGDVYGGELTLWIEGFYVKGYLNITSVNGSPVGDPTTEMPILVNGQLDGTELDLAFFTGPANTWPGPDNFGAVVYMYVMGFTPSGDVNGAQQPPDFAVWTAYHAWDSDQALVGGTLVIDNTIF